MQKAGNPISAALEITMFSASTSNTILYIKDCYSATVKSFTFVSIFKDAVNNSIRMDFLSQTFLVYVKLRSVLLGGYLKRILLYSSSALGMGGFSSSGYPKAITDPIVLL